MSQNKEINPEITIDEELILCDPSTSKWLKEQIVQTKDRDIINSIDDVEILLVLLNQRFLSLVS
jgi:hypothetical protein